MAHPEAKYPCVEGLYGFDLQSYLRKIQFLDRSYFYEEDFKTGPRRELHLSLEYETLDTARQFDLRFTDHLDPRFMRVNYWEVNGSATIAFDLFTRYNNDEHHPDMYATKFIVGFIDYCRAEGLPLQQIMDRWYPESRNYAQYARYYSATHEERIAAAGTVWSALIYKDLGFEITSAQKTTDSKGNPLLEVKYGLV